MVEMWVNGKLKGYFRRPPAYKSTIEYVVDYNARQTEYDRLGIVRLIALW